MPAEPADTLDYIVPFHSLYIESTVAVISQYQASKVSQHFKFPKFTKSLDPVSASFSWTLSLRTRNPPLLIHNLTYCQTLAMSIRSPGVLLAISAISIRHQSQSPAYFDNRVVDSSTLISDTSRIYNDNLGLRTLFVSNPKTVS